MGREPASFERDPGGSTASQLSPFEAEVIDVFVDLSQVLGQPKSYAQIYGLLFVSPRPLSMDDLIARLQISKGSASQGLKFLRTVGAVKAVDYNGARSTHYEAVAQLRKLAGRFLKNAILPRIADSEQKLGAINRSLAALPAAERREMAGRIAMLQSWTRNGRRVLPLVMRLLG